MRTQLIWVAAVLLGACSGDEQSSSQTASNVSASMATPADSASGAAATRTGKSAARSTSALNGRTGELTNPDDGTMVFLYYDLAGIAPPVDQWTESDFRVTSASAPDKAKRRSAVRAEFEAGAAAVRTAGFIRLSMNANLSDYDPTYGEFTVRALAPSSVVSFKALQHEISLRFGNGRDAQIWRVPQDQAQAIRDKLGRYGGASLDVLLKVTGVQPGPRGGTITTDVMEYEIRDERSGVTIARMRIDQQ